MSDAKVKNKMTPLEKFDAFLEELSTPKVVIEQEPTEEYDPDTEFVRLCPKLTVWKNRDKTLRERAKKLGVEPPSV